MLFEKKALFLNFNFTIKFTACFVRNSQISNNTEYIYNVSVIVFCFVCLFISIACYSRLIRVISRIIKGDTPVCYFTVIYIILQ